MPIKEYLSLLNLEVKNMKKIKKIVKKLKERVTVIGTTATATLILAESRVFAASNTESIDSFINFACDWLTKIRRNNCFSGWSYVCSRMAKRRC